MFAVEILFSEDFNSSESLLVRRPYFVVGGSDDAHLVIDDLAELPYELLISRGLGRSFSWISRSSDNKTNLTSSFPQVKGKAEKTASIELGKVRLTITSLDVDIALYEGEPTDQAGIRILRSVCHRSSPSVPAIMVEQPVSCALSFSPDQTIYIGRGRECLFRLDSPEVSSSHARIGFEAGRFWIEDLGSTNGTFVEGNQIAGRVNFFPQSQVVIARELQVKVLASSYSAEEGELHQSFKPSIPIEPLPSLERRSTYPVLIARSSACRPAKLVISKGSTLKLGRDPANDMWLGAPHISRLHCEVLEENGNIRIVDRSTNGTTVDGRILRFGEHVESTQGPKVIELGSDIIIGLCFSEAQEKQFLSSGDLSISSSFSDSRGSKEGPLGRQTQTFSVDQDVPGTNRTGEGRLNDIRYSGTRLSEAAASSGVREEASHGVGERPGFSTEGLRPGLNRSLPYRALRWRMARMKTGTHVVVRAGLAQRKSLVVLAGLSLLFVMFLLVSLLRGVL